MNREDKILKEAKKRYSIAIEGWTEFYEEAKEVLEFITGDQWDAKVRRNRTASGTPVLSANVLKTFIRQITNESRQNCPSIQVDPKNDGADQDTAEILSDLIRGIEQHSTASTAYDNASWYACTTGLGFFRIISEYESETSFDQKLIIKTIDDPSTVLLDPNHKEMDGSDAEYAFILSLMSKDEYKRAFGGSKLTANFDEPGWRSEGMSSQWVKEDQIVIAEYYWKSYTAGKLYSIFDAQSGETSTSTIKPPAELIESGQFTILDTRTTQECTIRWAKINDVEILEETVWPGKNIPIIAVKGDETWISGERKLSGAVKDAMDSQRAFNYYFSQQAEMISMAPKAPYIGAVAQFQNYEHIWKDAHIKNTAYLPYNPITVDGQLLPPPMRQALGIDIQASMAICAQAKDNIKSIFGIFDASMGQASNETSGKAILARTEQSHTTTYHFYDNLVKSIGLCGRILVEAIPVFYSTERSVQILKRNGISSTKTINRDSNLSDGSYGVVCETGPSYATRRQDSVSHMITLGGAYPQAMPLIADLIASESDWPGAKQIASRLRMALPPDIQQAEAQSGENVTKDQRIQTAVQQIKVMTGQIQQLSQQHQQADGLLHQAMQENKLLKEKGNLEVMKISKENELKKEQMKLDEEEMALSFKIKLRELDLQEKQMKIQEAKLAIEATGAMHEMDNDMHDRHTKHVATMTKISMANPVDENMGANGPEGLDKSFGTLSGKNID